MPHCYTESGMTVCASRGVPPNAVDDTLTLGDNDGNTSPDLMNPGIDNEELVYTFLDGRRALRGHLVRFRERHWRAVRRWQCRRQQRRRELLLGDMPVRGERHVLFRRLQLLHRRFLRRRGHLYEHPYPQL